MHPQRVSAPGCLAGSPTSPTGTYSHSPYTNRTLVEDGQPQRLPPSLLHRPSHPTSPLHGPRSPPNAGSGRQLSRGSDDNSAVYASPSTPIEVPGDSSAQPRAVPTRYRHSPYSSTQFHPGPASIRSPVHASSASWSGYPVSPTDNSGPRSPLGLPQPQQGHQFAGGESAPIGRFYGAVSPPTGPGPQFGSAPNPMPPRQHSSPVISPPPGYRPGPAGPQHHHQYLHQARPAGTASGNGNGSQSHFPGSGSAKNNSTSGNTYAPTGFLVPPPGGSSSTPGSPAPPSGGRGSNPNSPLGLAQGRPGYVSPNAPPYNGPHYTQEGGAGSYYGPGRQHSPLMASSGSFNRQLSGSTGAGPRPEYGSAPGQSGLHGGGGGGNSASRLHGGLNGSPLAGFGGGGGNHNNHIGAGGKMGHGRESSASSAHSCSSASSIRDDLPLCSNDDACPLINDRKHQRKFAHTCRLFPCYHGHITRHAKLFQHTAGQIAQPEGVNTSKLSTQALTSVNFSTISSEAPNAYRIYVSHGAKSYEIFGDWATVKIHTFKRYLHQVYHITPSSQVLVFMKTGKLMDDDISTVKSYGIEEDSVIQLKNDSDIDGLPRVPIEDL